MISFFSSFQSHKRLKLKLKQWIVFLESTFTLRKGHIQGSIQWLRRQELAGKVKKVLKFRVKIVYVEVGRWSKKDQILSTQTLNDPLPVDNVDVGQWILGCFNEKSCDYGIKKVIFQQVISNIYKISRQNIKLKLMYI